jgi:hypothetical protein
MEMATAMRDRQHAACKALATADVGAVEVLAARSDSTAPSFNTTSRKEKATTLAAKSEKPITTNAILADRILFDLIERLDRVREDHERAGDHELAGLRMLVGNALRTASDFLVQVREARHAGVER